MITRRTVVASAGGSIVRRRLLLAALPAMAANGAAGQGERKPVIAVLTLGMSTAAGVSRVRERLRALDLVEGRDFTVELRDAAGDPARLPLAAAELLAHHPAVVVLGGHVTAKAVQNLSLTTPIVIVGMNEPVPAASNITGVSNMSDASEARLLEILRGMLPGARRITAVLNPQNPSLQPLLEAFGRLAARFGIAVDSVHVAHPFDLEPAFATFTRARPDALLVLQDAALQFLANDIVARALARRVPTFGTLSFQFVESGALFSYAKDTDEAAQSAALLVARILRGARPGDLPVEQPTRFHLRINLTTARMLGITVPQAILERADEVIE
jgi:putative ABC transport system substrate-binding protein